MIKKENGITLVSLIVVIILMLIISSTAVNVSLNRFKINNFKKMQNDIELLEDKVSNYYLKYGGLPILRNSDNTGKKYTYTTLTFEKNSGDNSNYYILDLDAMEGVSLNYGKAGFENPNTSDDVYIINELTHTIYYVKGTELSGTVYHYIKKDNVTDNIPPSKPEIKVISGEQDEEGIYISEVKIEIVPGKDSWSGINKTTYSINSGTETDITTLTNNIYTVAVNGTYQITAKTYDKSGNISTNTITIQLEIGSN